jgi:arylsulfatase A-like enzyme
MGIVRWPDNVPAGLVTEEMLAAHDWLPTLASIANASNLIPKDRPIDGIDASAFILGKSKTTGRDSYMLFGLDGGLVSVKWKYYKTIFRYSAALEEALVSPQFPMMNDLSCDPGEKWNLFATRLDNSWIMWPVALEIGKYEASVKQYPNIKIGEDFKGYKK